MSKALPMVFPFTINGTSILPVSQSTLLRVTLDSSFIIPRIQSISKIYPFTLHYVSRILGLSASTAITLVHVAFISHLNHCNNLLKILPAFTLQCILCLADTVVSVNHKSDITYSYAPNLPLASCLTQGKTQRSYDVLQKSYMIWSLSHFSGLMI